MPLHEILKPVFSLLRGSLRQMTAEQYTHPCEQLNLSSVGQHVRHIIEMYQCLEEGYLTGTVDYDLRRRDVRIETDIAFALERMGPMLAGVDKPDKHITLTGNYRYGEEGVLRLSTYYHREVLYNMEHTVHHMALIRIGLVELGFRDIPSEFGVAPATVRHQRTCAR
jgi:hypothetical protein